MNQRTCFLIGIVIGLSVVLPLQSLHPAQCRPPREFYLVPIVVAADDLPAGSLVTFDQLSQRSVPDGFAFSSYVRPESASRAVGRRLTTAMTRGEPLRWQDLQDASPVAPAPN